jgi:alkylation response protein AidB-like acyl-CoA dehydrogenase
VDWSYDDDQLALRELARKMLEELAAHERLKQVEATDECVDRRLWGELAKANLLGLPFAESYGGSGLGLVELAILLEEIGRAVAPVPVFETVVLAGLPIAEFGDDAQRRRWLPRIASGEAMLTAALSEPLAEDPEQARTTARREGGGFLLDGRKGLAPAVHVAERVLVPAAAAGGVGLFLLDPRAPGVSLSRQEVTSRAPHFVLELAGARVGDEDVLVAPERGAAAARWLRERATVGLCAMAVGVAERALQMTAAYTSERRQFDRPVGSFQAVHQRAGDAYIDVQAMRLTLAQAVHRLAHGEDAEDALAVAKFWASEGGNRVTYAAQHLHGGIGVDLDYPLHRYYLWSRQLALTLGAATPQLVRIGEAIAAGRAGKAA